MSKKESEKSAKVMVSESQASGEADDQTGEKEEKSPGKSMLGTTLMYSPVPTPRPSSSKEAGDLSPPPPKKKKIDSLQDTLESMQVEADLQLTSALYHISKGNSEEGLKMIEGYRKTMKSHIAKAKELVKGINLQSTAHLQQIHSLQGRELFLQRKNADNEQVIKEQKASIALLTEVKEFQQGDPEYLLDLEADDLEKK